MQKLIGIHVALEEKIKPYQIQEKIRFDILGIKLQL